MTMCRVLGRKAYLLCLQILFLSVAACSDEKNEVSENSVVLVTALGEIRVEVDTKNAPLSAGDFLRYVEQGLYDDSSFYRVVRLDNDKGEPKIEVVQGGLPFGAPRLPPVAHEDTSQTGILHEDGVISLARGDPGTGSAAAFFICTGKQAELDFGGMRNPDGLGFAAFGRVVGGMKIVRAIHQLQSDEPTDSEYLQGQILSKPVRIIRAYKSHEVP